MTTYSIDLRKKVIACSLEGKNSLRKVAERFMVNKKTIQKWLKEYREKGDIQPLQVGSRKKSQLEEHLEKVRQMVQKYPDFTRARIL